MDTVKKFINWMLGMLATIALVICLYAGFLMVTAAGDDAKYKKGMGILKQAGIGLVIIGLSWLIVSVVFWLISTMSSTT
ncbi:MAG: pilin [Candidatus Peribacteria bacterium]|nr:pilin [Candidatus Peribacteria bacterium]